MLVITRQVGESIVIDDRIIVTLVREPQGGKVRLGVTAPREVPIRRFEGDATTIDGQRWCIQCHRWVAIAEAMQYADGGRCDACVANEDIHDYA